MVAVVVLVVYGGGGGVWGGSGGGGGGGLNYVLFNVISVYSNYWYVLLPKYFSLFHLYFTFRITKSVVLTLRRDNYSFWLRWFHGKVLIKVIVAYCPLAFLSWWWCMDQYGLKKCLEWPKLAFLPSQCYSCLINCQGFFHFRFRRKAHVALAYCKMNGNHLTNHILTWFKYQETHYQLKGNSASASSHFKFMFCFLIL